MSGMALGTDGTHGPGDRSTMPIASRSLQAVAAASQAGPESSALPSVTSNLPSTSTAPSASATIVAIDDNTYQRVIQRAKAHVVSKMLNICGFLGFGEKEILVQEALTDGASFVNLEKGELFSLLIQH